MYVITGKETGMKKFTPRNPIAKANGLVNKPKVFKTKKGKGSYNRKVTKGADGPLNHTYSMSTVLRSMP